MSHRPTRPERPPHRLPLPLSRLHYGIGHIAVHRQTCDAWHQAVTQGLLSADSPDHTFWLTHKQAPPLLTIPNRTPKPTYHHYRRQVACRSLSRENSPPSVLLKSSHGH